MKFLIDESTGLRVALFLKNLGYDVIYPAEKLKRISDLEVLERARKEGRIIITNDKDFGDYIFYQKFTAQGIILLRLKNHSAANKIRILKILLTRFSKKLSGNFLTVTEEKIRIKKI